MLCCTTCTCTCGKYAYISKEFCYLSYCELQVANNTWVSMSSSNQAKLEPINSSHHKVLVLISVLYFSKIPALRLHIYIYR